MDEELERHLTALEFRIVGIIVMVAAEIRGKAVWAGLVLFIIGCLYSDFAKARAKRRKVEA